MWLFAVESRRALAIAALCMLVVMMLAASAAARTAGDSLREVLAPLDPDLVASGRLHDRVLPMAGLGDLDGRVEAPPVTPERFRRALDELRLAALGEHAWSSSWPDAAALRRRAEANRRSAARAALQPEAAPLVEIAVIDLAYQSLRVDALDRGTLTLHTDSTRTSVRLVAADGVAADDILTDRRAVAAAALPAVTHHGANVRFVIPSALLLSDDPLDLAIDLDDGAGPRPVILDQPVTARYRGTGRKEMRLRLTAPDGTIRWTRFMFEVVTLDTPPPTATWPLEAGIAYEGSVATGEAHIYLAEGHAEITAPIVMIEGFDIDDSYDWPELYALLNQENLLEDLRAAGRDAVVLNFTSATEPIQRNAFLLVELLETVDAMLPMGVSYPVVGASMGGLVARYALSWLETQRDGHNCNLFLSFDAPHSGANIPLGLQCWIEFFAGESDDAAYMLDRLGTPAARQMLLYHHTALDGASAAADPLFDQLQADLAGLGGWPVQPRLAAVLNGSGAGQDQGFAPADQLIAYEYDSWMVDIIGNVWAVPDGLGQVVFHGMIDMVWPLPDSERTVTVAGTQPWDGAPGGYRATMAQLAESDVAYGSIVALHENHAFIPSVCALGLTGVDPFFDLAGTTGDMPFDSVFMPTPNEEHVLVTPASHAWIMDEILGTTNASEPVVQDAAVPMLVGARPNPFNPLTRIVFTLPRDTEVGLWVADLKGRRLRTLHEGELAAGRHAALWNGLDDAGSALSSGVYLVVLDHRGNRAAKRVTLVR